MSPADMLIHLLNFAAPAFGVALGVSLFSLLLMKYRAPGLTIYAQAAINFVVCMAVLVTGLWFFGRDGVMATYGAMLLCVASSQWVMNR
jgi:hypothetical protein